jgi:hypothetical protein
VLRNFDEVLTARLTQARPTVVVQAPLPVAEPVVTAAPLSAQRSFLMRPDGDWTPGDLRDFVVAEIERVHGRSPRDPIKESAIFNSFHSRWGAERAAAIARFVFSEPLRGYWMGAPITVNRFTKGSDRYFAERVLEMIAQA